MLLISHISVYARCLAGKVCGVVQSAWGTSLDEDKPGARDKILDTKVAHRARAGQTFSPRRKAQQLHEKIPKGVDGAVDLQTKIYMQWNAGGAPYMHRTCTPQQAHNDS